MQSESNEQEMRQSLSKRVLRLPISHCLFASERDPSGKAPTSTETMMREKIIVVMNFMMIDDLRYVEAGMAGRDRRKEKLLLPLIHFRRAAKFN